MKKFLALSFVIFSITRFVTFADGIVFGIDPSFIFKNKTDQSNMVYNVEFYDSYYRNLTFNKVNGGYNTLDDTSPRITLLTP